MIRIQKAALTDVLSWMDDKGLCIYCGDYACEIEHVVPRWTGLPTYTVKSCKECNSLAGKTIYTHLSQKAQDIRERRKKRYAKLLKTPEWTEDEMSELAYNLRTRIEKCEAARQFVVKQISWDPVEIFNIIP